MKRAMFLILGLFLAFNLSAQNGESPISYKSLGLQFSSYHSNGDAASAVVPSVSAYNGFGSFIDNPAVMALAEENSISIAWFYSNQNQTSSYLNSSTSNNFGNTDFGNIGMLYKFPTSQGSLVMGAGYDLKEAYDSKAFINGRNSLSTITDMFVDPSSSYNGIAYDAYAIEFGDVEETYYESIFRLGFAPGQFPGITQYVDVNNKRRMGEFSFFTATEFKKNLYAGISIGLTSGTSSYSRNFQEFDEFNDYDGDFIGADGNGAGGTDIKRITLADNIDSDIVGVTIRSGLAYTIGEKARVGASLTLPSKLVITESYSSGIKSDFDDGTATDTYDFFGEFEYAITRPSQLNIGGSILDIGGFSISASAELIDYSNIELSLLETNISDPSEKAALLQNEQDINAEIKQDYNSVANFKIGTAYKLNNRAEIKGGYAFYPAKSKKYEVEQSVLSAGLSFPLTRTINFDISGQYSTWTDRSVLYSYSDITSGNMENSNVSQDFESLNIVAGIRILF